MDVIDRINSLFLSSNVRIRTEIINSLPVILIFNNDTLTLMRYGKIVDSKQLDLQQYHIIKSVCHFVSGLTLGLFDPTEDLITETIDYITNNKNIFVYDGIKYW